MDAEKLLGVSSVDWERFFEQVGHLDGFLEADTFQFMRCKLVQLRRIHLESRCEFFHQFAD